MCEYINNDIIQEEDFTMEEKTFEKSNGLWYELQGDYYISCLIVQVEKEKLIGIQGRWINTILYGQWKLTIMI